MRKKQSKRFIVRANRKILNRFYDFFSVISGRRTNKNGYGVGLSRSHLVERE